MSMPEVSGMSENSTQSDFWWRSPVRQMSRAACLEVVAAAADDAVVREEAGGLLDGCQVCVLQQRVQFYGATLQPAFGVLHAPL